MLTQQLSSLLNDLIYHVVTLDNDFAENYGLTGSEYKMLRYLGKNPAASMKEIAGFLSVSMPRATYIADSLKTKKLIIRKNGEDRRKVLLQLSQKGAEVEQDSQEKYYEISKRLLSPLTDPEKEQMLELLEKSRNVLFAPPQK
jgi:DNA-binding MarR family transcriptional regulator